METLEILDFLMPKIRIYWFTSRVLGFEKLGFELDNRRWTTKTIDYRCDNRHFRLSAHNCQVPTPTSHNLEVEQQIRILGAD